MIMTILNKEKKSLISNWVNIINSRFKTKQDGFSLVEVLVIIAVFVILISSATSLVSRRITNADLDGKTQEIMGLIDKARNYSVSGFKNDVWGIRVLDNNADCTGSADCVIMFKGIDYASRDSSFDQEVSLGTGTTGSYLESSQENQFYFGVNSGWLTTSSDTALSEQLIVIKNNTGDQRSIVINPTGVASLFDCGQDKVFDIEGNSYDTLKIGSQCWMAENLNIGTMLASAGTAQTGNGIIEKWCYDDSEANCTSNGALYKWDEAMGYVTTEGAQGICMAGWHIPTDGEFDTLVANYPSASAGTELKLNGVSDFNLSLAGEMNGGSSTYDLADDYGILWTSTQSDSTNAYRQYVRASLATVTNDTNAKTYGFSVRCLKDY